MSSSSLNAWPIPDHIPGINFAFAKLLLQQGCSVMIGDLSLRPEAQDLLKQYPHPPPSPGQPSAVFHDTNVRSWAQLSALWAQSLATFPQVDIVVPGAGLFDPPWSSFWNAPKTATYQDSPSRDPSDADPGTYAIIDVNLTHPARLSQLAIGYWSQRQMPGNLLHVSSIAGHTVSLGSPLYFATKHGLTALVRSLGDLKETLGVRVSAVAPGAVMTPMLLEDPSKKMFLADGGRELLLDPEEVARAMLQLCVDPEYGDGTILEVTKGETRVVPLFNADPPSGVGSMLPGYAEEARALREWIKQGVKV